MGTKGTFGFFHKGKYYVCYNHYDSYPSCLGVHLILEILDANFDEWIELLEKIKIVDKEIKPTEDEKAKLEKYTNLYVGSQSKSDWYCLLRFTQGSFYHVLHSGYLMNHVDTDGLPIHHEYTYVLNFDEGTLDLSENFDDQGEDIKIRLKPEELLDVAKGWSKDPLPEKYDPEDELQKDKDLEKEHQDLIKSCLSRIGQ